MTKVMGLTGGIATGKSTVSQFLRTLGYPVIDADEIVRLISQKDGEAYPEIIDYFGKKILLENGEIDRVALGKLVFSDQKKREQLNAIIHPKVRKRMLEEVQKLSEKGALLVFLDIPLLYESKLTSFVDEVMVVYCDKETQLERLQLRNGYSIEEANLRIAAQMDIEDKKKLADYIIDNRGSLEETEAQVHQILAKLTR